MLRNLVCWLLVIINAVMVANVWADDQPQPCSSPHATEFDFWLGDWDLTWADSGRGRNTISKEFDGCVIRENFASLDSVPLRGTSVSVFNPNTGKWHQTWVDNQGSYLDFTGEFKDGRMILTREAKPAGKPAFLQRMVWFDVAADSLKWNWERSDDGGKSWKVMWAINYTRRK